MVDIIFGNCLDTGSKTRTIPYSIYNTVTKALSTVTACIGLAWGPVHLSSLTDNVE